MFVTGNDGQTAIENEPKESINEPQDTPKESPKDSEPPKEGEPPKEVPAYTPNYKFKVMDEEKEFDEWVKGAIKDKEHEEKLRDLYTKAYGLEHHKKTHETLKERVEKHYRPLETEYTNFKQNLAYLDQVIRKKDYQTFFDTLKIPRQDILKYALDVVKYEEMPPEQKAVIDRQREVERYNEMLAQQNMSYQQQIEQQAVQARTIELNSELMKPEVSSFVQNFDTRAGKPGAFREQVIRHAELAYYRNQVDLPVEQAVREVMAQYGSLVAPQALPTPTPAPQAQQKPPVIPNVQSSGNSPAKVMPTSLADLRKLAKQKADEQF